MSGKIFEESYDSDSCGNEREFQVVNVLPGNFRNEQLKCTMFHALWDGNPHGGTTED